MSDLVAPVGWAFLEDHEEAHPVLVPVANTSTFTASSFDVPTEFELRNGRQQHLALNLDRPSQDSIILRMSAHARGVMVRLTAEGGRHPAVVIYGGDRTNTQPLLLSVESDEPEQPVEIELRYAHVVVERCELELHFRVTAPSVVQPASLTAIHATADITVISDVDKVKNIDASSGVSLTLPNGATLQRLSMVEAGKVTVLCEARGQRTITVEHVASTDASVLVAGKKVQLRVGDADAGTMFSCDAGALMDFSNATLEDVSFRNVRLMAQNSHILGAAGTVTVAGDFVDSTIQARDNRSLTIDDISALRQRPGKSKLNLAGSSFIDVTLPTTSKAVHMLDALDAAHRFSPAFEVEPWSNVKKKDPDEARREATLLAMMLATAEEKHGEPSALADMKFQRYQLRRYATPNRAEQASLYFLRWFGYGQRWRPPLWTLFWLSALGATVHESSVGGFRLTLTGEAVWEWTIAFLNILLVPVGLLRTVEGSSVPDGGWGLLYRVILALASVAFAAVVVAFRRLTRYE